MKGQATLFSSARQDWETPPDLFRALHAEFRFARDVGTCACGDNALLPERITRDQDALDAETAWGAPGEAVYCNPPYGRCLAEWVKRGREEARARGMTVVMLLPARTDTQWFHEQIWRKAEVRFLRGRLRFRVKGEPKDAAPFPSMIVVWRGEQG